MDQLMRKYHGNRKDRVIVFVLYKKEATRVEAMLQKQGWKVCYQQQCFRRLVVMLCGYLICLYKFFKWCCCGMQLEGGQEGTVDS